MACKLSGGVGVDLRAWQHMTLRLYTALCIADFERGPNDPPLMTDGARHKLMTEANALLQHYAPSTVDAARSAE